MLEAGADKQLAPFESSNQEDRVYPILSVARLGDPARLKCVMAKGGAEQLLLTDSEGVCLT